MICSVKMGANLSFTRDKMPLRGSNQAKLHPAPAESLSAPPAEIQAVGAPKGVNQQWLNQQRLPGLFSHFPHMKVT